VPAVALAAAENLLAETKNGKKRDKNTGEYRSLLTVD